MYEPLLCHKDFDNVPQIKVLQLLLYLFATPMHLFVNGLFTIHVHHYTVIQLLPSDYLHNKLSHIFIAYKSIVFPYQDLAT